MASRFDEINEEGDHDSLIPKKSIIDLQRSVQSPPLSSRLVCSLSDSFRHHSVIPTGLIQTKNKERGKPMGNKGGAATR
jgi:hypothetical protein